MSCAGCEYAKVYGGKCKLHGHRTLSDAKAEAAAHILDRALADARAVEHDIRLSRIDVRNLVELTAEWNADRAAHNYGPPITLEGALSRLLQTTRDMVTRKVE